MKGLLIVSFVFVCYVILMFITVFVSNEQLKISHKSWDDLISDCFYINMDSATERMNYMETNFTKHGIDCERFSAINGVEDLCDHQEVTKGAMGCKLSHLYLLKKVKRGGWTIIFEDDILFPDTNDMKGDIVNYLDSVPPDAELVFFGTSTLSIIGALITGSFKKVNPGVFKTSFNLTCGHAYAITYEGAQKWISEIEEFLCLFPFDMHSKGIEYIYLCTKKSNLISLVGWNNTSYICQNKKKFGYLDSQITTYIPKI